MLGFSKCTNSPQEIKQPATKIPAPNSSDTSKEVKRIVPSHQSPMNDLNNDSLVKATFPEGSQTIEEYIGNRKEKKSKDSKIHQKQLPINKVINKSNEEKPRGLSPNPH